jgi:hypothetical protein
MQIYLQFFSDAEHVGATAHKTEAGAIEALRKGVRDHFETHGLGLMQGSLDAATERLSELGINFWIEEAELRE